MHYDPFNTSTQPGVGFFADLEQGTLWEGPLALYRRMGLHVSTAEEAFAETWGISPASTELDHRNRYTSPYTAAETVRMVDVQRCVDVDPGDIVPTGVSFELCRLSVPESHIGVLEQIPSMFDQVVALDAGGIPIFDFGSLNGERLCRNELVHPDPLVNVPLTWEFSLLWTDAPDFPGHVGGPAAYPGPVPPSAVAGVAIGPPWTDARMGSQNRWSQHQQYYAPAGSVARYWVTLRGPTDRFAVRVGARIQGYIQSGGRYGAALQNALTRN
jgi:hypothetical protein